MSREDVHLNAKSWQHNSEWSEPPDPVQVAALAKDYLEMLAVVEAAQEDLIEHDEALLVAGSGDFYKLRTALAALTTEQSGQN